MRKSRFGRPRGRRLFAMGTGLALLGSQLAGGPVNAQSKEELDKARAMFLEGVSLAAANNCAAALTKYQAVVKVKMTAQVVFNIAECEERLGKLVSSLGSYRLAASLVVDNKPVEVARDVGERIASLEARIPRLIIERTEQTSKIELDGQEIGSSQIGKENLVDPGTHVVSGKIGETEVWRESVQIAEKEAKTVTVKIDVAKFKPPEQPSATVTATATAPPPPPPAEPPSRLPAYLVGGAGLVSLGVGFALMGVSLGTASELEQICGPDRDCPPSEKGKYDSGRMLAGVSTGLLALGGAALATGVVLFFVRGGSGTPQQPAANAPAGTARPGVRNTGYLGPEVGVSVRSGPGSAGLGLVGRF